MRIRPGTPADIPEVSRVYLESWRAAYQGIAPEAFVKGPDETSAYKVFTESIQSNSFSYFLHLAQVDGKVAGFADGGKERSNPESGVGELYAIYLLPRFQGQGIGRALLLASRDSLARAGMDRMVVWVLEQSPARKFYEAMGGVLTSGVKRLELEGHSLKLVAYRWDHS